ncbi:cytochrome d ubiquinol oxidase subunit II [Spiractinospora alimapuensis]|uniref:cytochrome d ubiquinol oxidase subunit II n=1 Tax=Spiractinospora alimapuensis TaxID=2820884 RepID=UPI001EEB734F|nr:cytochrome d ubiquinol oxidase subunit II [Spiractinospora alimapuensis]QVQ51652.1 cytochrome d ubiquinol oxidase subunit II [Spiractinospora alimapuensis]
MDLVVIWFIAIAVLWIGYLVLEGFDFGVGILLPFVGKDNTGRRVMINSIGPVWDGNEVWLITAGGAMFAAFPAWYASVFSGFYIPLLLILLALIGRGVAFEYRGKRDSDRWRAGWDATIFLGSAVPAFLWGVAFGNFLRGVELDSDHIMTAGLLNLLNPYALLGGITTLSLFILHGAVFLTLKTDGEVRTRARRAALGSAVVAVPAAAVFLLWTQVAHGKTWTWFPVVAAALALCAAVLLAIRGREGWSFTATATAIGAAGVSIFGALFPDLLPSTIDPAYGLDVYNASSAEYTLTVMSWVAVFFLPLVILYQGWSYWVFRKRVTSHDVSPVPSYGGSSGGTGSEGTSGQ